MSGILARQQILARIQDHQLVENIDPECVSPASYELRIGSYLDRRTDESVDLAKDEAIAIIPNGFLLLGTVEVVNLPLDLLGLVYLRSTYARQGFVSWFQGLVDPGYSGVLTIALHNPTQHLIPLYGGERIAHLVFEQLSEPADRGYSGVYQHSRGATPSRHKFPVAKVVGSWPSPAFRTQGDSS